MRQLKRILFSFTLLILAFGGCGVNDATEDDDLSVDKAPVIYNGGLLVNYLDVGEGDAILIKLPDGKVMLIDCGEENDVNKEYLEESVASLGGKIDYFILSHPDGDHVGNATFLINECEIDTLFLPDIKNYQRFASYCMFYETALSKDLNIKRSEKGFRIETEDYFIAILSPYGKISSDSPYHDLDIEKEITSEMINATSPIIYFECYGVRFLFTGDASAKMEDKIIDDYKVKFTEMLFGKGKVNLDSVDFLKVSHHGGNDASSRKFLSVIKPSYAVISVGENIYGHPSDAVINRLNSSNSNLQILRTDLSGTISVNVKEDGKIAVNNLLE